MARIDEERRRINGKDYGGDGYGSEYKAFPSNLLEHNAYVKLTAFDVKQIDETKVKAAIEKILAGDITTNCTPIGHFFLPIPQSGLNMTDTLNYGEESGANVIQQLAKWGLGELFGRVPESMLKQQTGYSANEYITNMFKGIGLRSFDYVWNFIPESKEDAETLSQILEWIRSNAIPTYDRISPIIKHPSIWLIENRVKGKLLLQTNFLVIESISINYDDTTGTTFFKDGSPVKTNLNIKFKEIYPSGNELGK
jgi:hypothetical protein